MNSFPTDRQLVCQGALMTVSRLAALGLYMPSVVEKWAPDHRRIFDIAAAELLKERHSRTIAHVMQEARQVVNATLNDMWPDSWIAVGTSSLSSVQVVDLTFPCLWGLDALEETQFPWSLVPGKRRFFLDAIITARAAAQSRLRSLREASASNQLSSDIPSIDSSLETLNKALSNFAPVIQISIADPDMRLPATIIPFAPRRALRTVGPMDNGAPG